MTLIWKTLKKNVFNGINIASIKILDKKLSLILSKYILENGDINVYAILHKNIKTFNILDFKDLDSLIEEKFPKIAHSIRFMDNYLKRLSSDITNDKISLQGKTYLKSELSNLIINHNKNLVIPASGDLLEEKEEVYAWYTYNTPIMDYLSITPMTGTAYEGSSSYLGTNYRSWIMASSYLLIEYNIWKKAMYYLENKNKITDFSSTQFKQAYDYLIVRNFFIFGVNNSYFEDKNKYIQDFTLDNVIYRELCDDFLYILLNLLLANKIIGNIALENSLNNDNKYFDILKDIIKDHYAENKDGYSCLKSLRWYKINNYLSEYQIKEIEF